MKPFLFDPRITLMNDPRAVKGQEHYKLPGDHLFTNDWTTFQWVAEITEQHHNKLHSVLSAYEGFSSSFPKWQAESSALKSFIKRMKKVIWDLVHIPNGDHKEGPLLYFDQNYSRPEQPARPFSEDDIRFLIQGIDNDIRILEGKREVGERNYLDFHDSGNLNRLKLTRKIIEEWNLYRQLGKE